MPTAGIGPVGAAVSTTLGFVCLLRLGGEKSVLSVLNTFQNNDTGH